MRLCLDDTSRWRVGGQIFQGALQGRCFDVDTGEVEGEDICSAGFIESALEEFWIRKGMQLAAGGLFRCQVLMYKLYNLNSKLTF